MNKGNRDPHFGVIVTQAPYEPIEDRRFETVERKGVGHPDSVADGVAEAASRALSKLYIAEFGRVLHHNLDKTLLVAGRTTTKFGYGKVIRFPRVIIAGRATEKVGSKSLPVGATVAEAARDYLRGVCPGVNVDKVSVEFIGGQTDTSLLGIFSRPRRLANDTSVGVSVAPYSDTENVVLRMEEFIVGTISNREAGLGRDVKVMAIRDRNKIRITVAIAMIATSFANPGQYNATADALERRLVRFAKGLTDRDVELTVNWTRKLGSYYLTATGYSWENGDDGAVGRGNRVNGLITPNRPMSLEGVAGKNPSTHPGKLYNILAYELAQRIATEHSDEVREVTVNLASSIGRPIDQPQTATVELLMRKGIPLARVRHNVAGIVSDGLSHMDSLSERITLGMTRIF